MSFGLCVVQNKSLKHWCTIIYMQHCYHLIIDWNLSIGISPKWKFLLIWWLRSRPTQSPELMLPVYVSANHGYAETCVIPCVLTLRIFSTVFITVLMVWSVASGMRGDLLTKEFSYHAQWKCTFRKALYVCIWQHCDKSQLNDMWISLQRRLDVLCS